MLPDETRTAPGPTTGTTIAAFRWRHGLTVGRLAALLDLDPETLCRYEEAGAAPPWLAYALLGVEYQEFGVVTGPSQGDSLGGEALPPGKVSSAREAGLPPADARPAAA